MNSTRQSTRSGGPLAAAWAVLQHVGDDGYLALAKASLGAVEKMVDEDIAAFLVHLDPDSLSQKEFGELLAAAGMGGGAGLPERMAEINAMHAIARPEAAGAPPAESLGLLYRPS
ncbi:hypothetical protein E1161_00690 [Saccharopolyspora aridisoli]|uniref:Uncharacterized protein n=1 Tax=Saccharopolyspora aridisoli TaxID=2530385 RepID=A0A4R4UW23_9PSEU|nr:hypothetical protein [Saccharopolyspora aridisoli]TDC96778.1 hypothetical protein E1161_00690 [Saccharopolyspora aridisoli]